MKKIRLDVETLRVESFTTEDETWKRGTIVGHASQAQDGCVHPTAIHHSCHEDYTFEGEDTCQCFYPDTDVQICCTVNQCSGVRTC